MSMNYIPEVISGFTSGAAIIIGLSQLKWLGGKTRRIDPRDIVGFDLPKSQYIYETPLGPLGLTG